MAKGQRNILTVGMGYTHAQSEQHQHDDEKGVITVAIKDKIMKIVSSRTSHSKGVELHAA